VKFKELIMAGTKTTATRKKNVVAIKDPDITSQIETLRADIATLAGTIKSQAKSTANEKVASAKKVASQTTDTAKVKYDELATTAETQIREKPITSVAIAVGVGLLLGALTRR